MSKTPRGCFPLPGSDASPEFSPGREQIFLVGNVKIISPSYSLLCCLLGHDGTSALSMYNIITYSYDVFRQVIVTVLACHLRILLSATAGVGSSVEPAGRLLQLGQDRR